VTSSKAADTTAASDESDANSTRQDALAWLTLAWGDRDVLVGYELTEANAIFWSARLTEHGPPLSGVIMGNATDPANARELVMKSALEGLRWLAASRQD
jgi:hypothetical protein